jgi:hypothetical protein
MGGGMSALETAKALARQKRGELGEVLLSLISLLSQPESSETGPGSGETEPKTPSIDCEKSEISERSPPPDKLAALIAMDPPTGFSPARWSRIIDAAGVFLDKWAAEADRLGWSDLDVFGCDPAAPDARFDCMGVTLLCDRCEIVGIDETGADLLTNTGARQRYRRHPMPAGTIPVWDLNTIPAAIPAPGDRG